MGDRPTSERRRRVLDLDLSDTLIRGAILTWYPYPFFNPAQVGGYGGVALYCAGMLVGFLVLALLIRWAGNALGARRDARVASDRMWRG